MRTFFGLANVPVRIYNFSACSAIIVRTFFGLANVPGKIVQIILLCEPFLDL